MMLAHPKLETQLKNDKINVLTVEDPKLFRDFCIDMRETFTGADDTFVLSDGDRLVNIAKNGLLIENPIDFAMNDKKLINKLYAELAEIADEKFARELAAISDSVADLVNKLNSESSVQIDWFNESPVNALFKSFGIAIKDDHVRYSERLYNYVSAAVELLRIKMIVMFNAKCFYTGGELSEIYKLLRYNGVLTVLLENSYGEKCENERAVIIDKDLCEIVA